MGPVGTGNGKGISLPLPLSGCPRSNILGNVIFFLIFHVYFFMYGSVPNTVFANALPCRGADSGHRPSRRSREQHPCGGLREPSGLPKIRMRCGLPSGHRAYCSLMARCFLSGERMTAEQPMCSRWIPAIGKPITARKWSSNSLRLVV